MRVRYRSIRPDMEQVPEDVARYAETPGPCASEMRRTARTLGHAATSLASVLALGACAAPFGTGLDREARPDAAVPEAVVAMAAPYQDVATARLMPEDGCYWYRHVGPVETTMLPLRTPAGDRICSQQGVRDAA